MTIADQIHSLLGAATNDGLRAIAESYGMFAIDREFALRDQFTRLYLSCGSGWIPRNEEHT